VVSAGRNSAWERTATSLGSAPGNDGVGTEADVSLRQAERARVGRREGEVGVFLAEETFQPPAQPGLSVDERDQ
jgi:hypothetical protein